MPEGIQKKECISCHRYSDLGGELLRDRPAMRWPPKQKRGAETRSPVG